MNTKTEKEMMQDHDNASVCRLQKVYGSVAKLWCLKVAILVTY